MLLFCSTCKIIQIPKIITAEEHIPGDISLIIILYSRFLLARNRKLFVALRWDVENKILVCDGSLYTYVF